MGSTTIRLDEDVYARLKAEMREGETFSEAVDRLLEGGSLLDLVGLWSDADVDAIREELDSADSEAVKDVDEIIERRKRE